MRRVIWKSTDFFQLSHRVVMDPIVVEAYQEPLPVYASYSPSEANAIGWVSDLRIENGDLTGEVDWDADGMLADEIFDAINVRLSGAYYLEIDEADECVERAVLAYVNLAPKGLGE